MVFSSCLRFFLARVRRMVTATIYRTVSRNIFSSTVRVRVNKTIDALQQLFLQVNDHGKDVEQLDDDWQLKNLLATQIY